MSGFKIAGAIASAAALSACAAGYGATSSAPVDSTGRGMVGRGEPARAPRAHPQQPGPEWEGQGAPISTWALKPEEAQPYDPLFAPKAYAAKDGETLYAIAARFQVPLRALIDANRLAPPFAVSEGVVLKLPPPQRYKVKPGETLLAIAARYNVDARSLALLNRLPKPYALRPGDVLVLPGLARAPSAELAATPSKGPSVPIKLVWPVQGKILRAYGPAPGGKRSDGVDIEAKAGAPIKAAADGVVAYAGEDLPGYGGLLLVQHPGGWITAYAQAGKLLKREGDKVRQGETIASVGPKDGRPRLHFQLRRGPTPIDPLPELPRA